MPHKYLRIAKTYAILFLMRSKERQYIIENMARQSTREIAEALGIKERKVRKFLEKSRESRKGKNRVDRFMDSYITYSYFRLYRILQFARWKVHMG